MAANKTNVSNISLYPLEAQCDIKLGLLIWYIVFYQHVELFPGAAEIHVEEQVNAFLLNGKEWEFLSEIRVDENAQSLDYRSVRKSTD